MVGTNPVGLHSDSIGVQYNAFKSWCTKTKHYSYVTSLADNYRSKARERRGSELLLCDEQLNRLLCLRSYYTAVVVSRQRLYLVRDATATCT